MFSLNYINNVILMHEKYVNTKTLLKCVYNNKAL